MPRLALLITTLLALASPAAAAPFNSIVSSAMMPTLGEGDVIFTLPYTVPKQRGDIVVFAEDGYSHVSRIIALPGETVTVSGGVVFIDGTPLNQTQLTNPIAGGCPELMPPGKKCAFYREALPGGASHVIISLDTAAYYDNTQAVTLGDDEYFVMSDNRDNAVDSREFGPVRDSAILGLVQNITFSPRFGLWPDRLAGFPEAQ